MLPFGKAVCYQGYRKGQSKIKEVYPSKSEILEDLLILEKEFSYIRVYDCSKHTKDILEVIHEHNIKLKVMLSMYLLSEENHDNHLIYGPIDQEILDRNVEINNRKVEKVHQILKQYKKHINVISVGNESRSIWNINRVSDERIAYFVGKIQELTDIPVTFCEEWKYWVNDLYITAKQVDIISIHSYPVWNDVSIENALEETIQHFTQVSKLYPEKPIIITEAGWPTDSDNKRIQQSDATVANHVRYRSEVEKWAQKQGTVVYIFEAFDEFWKGGPDPHDPEKNWGIFTDDRVRKQ